MPTKSGFLGLFFVIACVHMSHAGFSPLFINVATIATEMAQPMSCGLARIPFFRSIKCIGNLMQQGAGHAISGSLKFLRVPTRFLGSRFHTKNLTLRSVASDATYHVGNPLLNLSDFPNFNEVDASHVKPGIRALIAEAESNLAKFEADFFEVSMNRTAGDLLSKLEMVSDKLNRAWSVCSHLKAVKDSDAFRAAYDEVQPDYVNFGLRLSQSQSIFRALKTLRSRADWNDLSEAQRRVIEAEIRDAELSGVGLSGAAKERFNAIEQRLAQLSTNFANNLLDATKNFSLRLTSKEQVRGLPESALALAAQTARARGDAGATAGDGPWVLTLDAPSFLPAMQFAADRGLRHQLYHAYQTRASDLGPPARDNGPVAMEILRLRKERAGLLGRRHHADVSTASKMATVESALALIERLRAASFAPALKELEELQAFAARRGLEGALQPWDLSFYAEALREERFAFSEEDLRPYFALPRVLQGLFGLARRLFEVEVAEVTGPEAGGVWHRDVRLFRVERGGAAAAFFYLDPYSRPGEKRGGAWMDVVQGRSRAAAPPGGPPRLPVAHMVCNQSPPVGDKPSLMTFREVETLFHEFGHALQHMLTTQEEGLAAGIRNVEWDAVELPSQLMENWCYDRPTVDGMAAHYLTGEPIPDPLWSKVRGAKEFRGASMMLRQLHFAATDLELHSAFDPSGPASIHDVYRQAARRFQVLPPAAFDRFLCGFSHIFAGGYSAGYYSYKWAEVLSADSFGAFEEAGLDQEAAVRATGRRFRDTVLALGGGAAPAAVFRAFRGRDPAPDALLRHSGLAPAPA